MPADPVEVALVEVAAALVAVARTRTIKADTAADHSKDADRRAFPMTIYRFSIDSI
jgi:hypothetical protein